MKKMIIFILISLSIIGANTKIDELLKNDSQNNSVSVEAVKKSGKVESLKGQAFLQKDGSTVWLQLVKNALIDEKSTIVTMDNSEIKIKLDNDILVNVGEKSKLYIENLKSKPKSKEITEAGLKLLFGKVYSNISKKLETGAKYEIKSGSVVAGVRGTRFLVTNLKGGIVEVRVYDGFVVIDNIIENKQYTIQTNQKVNISNEGKTEDIKEMTSEELNEESSTQSKDEKINELKEILMEYKLQNEPLKERDEVQNGNKTNEIIDLIDTLNEGTWKPEDVNSGATLIIKVN